MHSHARPLELLGVDSSGPDGPSEGRSCVHYFFRRSVSLRQPDRRAHRLAVTAALRGTVSPVGLFTFC